MSSKDVQEDPVLAALRELRTCDVSPARAQRLRSRCHRGLTLRQASRHLLRRSEAGVWRRAMRVFAGSWCAAYVFEILRRAAAVYGF
jgi:hypothetical protein